MTLAAFPEAAQQYADAGIATFPVGSADGKRPLVRHPQRFGLKASLSIAAKFPEANVGFWCGRRNGLTVVDVDSADERELTWALDTFGQSPIIVRTGSGKFHAWYRHNGERRRIRPIPGHEIDVLGENGYCVAPPSVRPDGGRYEFVAGSLADLGRLPAIKPRALAEQIDQNPAADTLPPQTTADRIPEGRRHRALFDLGREIAATASSLDELATALHRANTETNSPPLPPAEVLRTARGLWRYRSEGRLFQTGRQSLVLDMAFVGPLIRSNDADAVMLMLALQQAHGARREPFAASPEGMEKGRVIGNWSKRRYRDGLRRLCELGRLRRVTEGGKGKRDPAMYAFA